MLLLSNLKNVHFQCLTHPREPLNQTPHKQYPPLPHLSLAPKPHTHTHTHREREREFGQRSERGLVWHNMKCGRVVLAKNLLMHDWNFAKSNYGELASLFWRQHNCSLSYKILFDIKEHQNISYYLGDTVGYSDA
jgi:hypothetical protein